MLPQAHKAYLEGTEHRTASFKSLTKSDAAAAKVIEQRMKKLMKLQVRHTHTHTLVVDESVDPEHDQYQRLSSTPGLTITLTT